MPSLTKIKKIDSGGSIGKSKWKLLQSLLMLAVIALAAFIFLQSSVFAVKTIKFTGNQHIPKEVIEKLSGIQKGVNIFQINLKKSSANIKTHPYIKEVKIERELPSTIKVSIVERNGVGLVFDGERYAVVDGDGVVITREEDLTESGLPLITGVDTKKVTPGQKINSEKLGAALAYLKELPINLRGSVSEFNVSNPNNILVYTMNGIQVKLGNDERVQEKIKLYDQLLEKNYSDNVLYIDISYNGPPVIKTIE